MAGVVFLVKEGEYSLSGRVENAFFCTQRVDNERASKKEG
jgi:hypothetical protein